MLLYNPAADIELPRLEHRLPKCVLTPSEADQVINQCNVNEPFGLRDRAILETFYSTGIRRMEMINLGPHDLDAERGVLTVRLGKGKKDRVVPIGDRAVAWIDRYLIEVRPRLLIGDKSANTLFLNDRGCPFSRDAMTHLVRDTSTPPILARKGPATCSATPVLRPCLKTGPTFASCKSCLATSNSKPRPFTPK